MRVNFTWTLYRAVEAATNIFVTNLQINFVNYNYFNNMKNSLAAFHEHN